MGFVIHFVIHCWFDTCGVPCGLLNASVGTLNTDHASLGLVACDVFDKHVSVG